MRLRLLIVPATLLFATSVVAKELHVAVAANFASTMQIIASTFESRTGHKLKISSGSSGKLYAQIRHGAPFDLFFAADTLRPELLEQQQLAIAGSRFTYAIGQLVLWSREPDLIDSQGEVLGTRRFRHLAIANPKLAPYGAAARSVLEHKGMWQPLQGRLVRGESITQTFQFVQTGNAELGFIALSQLGINPATISGSYWLIPSQLYPPIEQQVVVLRDSIASREFIQFFRSDEIRSLIRSHGYRIAAGSK